MGSVRTLLRRAVLIRVIAPERHGAPVRRENPLIPADGGGRRAVAKVLLHERRLAAPAEEVLLGVASENGRLVEGAGELRGEGGVAGRVDGEGGRGAGLGGPVGLVGEVGGRGGGVGLAGEEGGGEGRGQEGGEDGELHLDGLSVREVWGGIFG